MRKELEKVANTVRLKKTVLTDKIVFVAKSRMAEHACLFDSKASIKKSLLSLLFG